MTDYFATAKEARMGERGAPQSYADILRADPWYPLVQELVKAKHAARQVYDEMVHEAYTEYTRAMDALLVSQQSKG